MPQAWRICKARHASHVASGEGARLYGGRWTSVGVRAVYASESLSLAVLEVLAHVSADALTDYSVFGILVPESLVTPLDRGSLPPNWRDYPAPQELQALGDEWIESRRSAALEVPSAIIASESNYLLNPGHDDFESILFGPEQSLDIDPRLIKGAPLTRGAGPRRGRGGRP